MALRPRIDASNTALVGLTRAELAAAWEGATKAWVASLAAELGVRVPRAAGRAKALRLVLEAGF